MDINQSISQTKKEFENSFSEADYYNRQTQDEQHLQMILESIQIENGMRILDLGTGSGYLAFEIAKKYPKANITGLDIVDKTLNNNRKKAKEKNLGNLEFISYDGINFPFDDKSFDYVITRYVLHHFPVIDKAFLEIARVLKAKGKLFLSDPTPNEDDVERFVDVYMQMKNDGHIKFYTSEEFVELAKRAGLSRYESFRTTIRFPRWKKDATGLPVILKNHSQKVIDGYKMDTIGEEIYITEQVLNMTFIKE